MLAESIRNKISGQEKSMVLQIRGITKDNRILDLEVHGRVAIRKGNPSIVGSVLDISELSPDGILVIRLLPNNTFDTHLIERIHII